MARKKLLVKTTLIYLVIVGVIVIPVFLWSQNTHAVASIPVVSTTTPSTIPTAVTPTPTPKITGLVYGTPVRLSIPNIGLNLPIVNGTYNPKTQAWSLSNDVAQYATITAKPNNEQGNTLIYGHDINTVFAATANLKVGDQLLIFTDNNHILSYTYTGSDNVSPNNTNILSYTGPARITLLTCSGWFSSLRALMYFKFESVIQ